MSTFFFYSLDGYVAGLLRNHTWSAVEKREIANNEKTGLDGLLIKK